MREIAVPVDRQENSNDTPSGLLLSSRQRKCLLAYAAMLLSWLFDFKSEGAGQGLAFQGVFLLFYFVSTIFFFSLSRSGLRGAGITLFLLSSLNFLFVSYVTAVYLGSDLYDSGKTGLNIIIYIISTLSAYKIVIDTSLHLRPVRHVIAYSTLLYMISKVIVIFVYQGELDLSTIRYQIIGSSVVAVTCYAVMMLRFRILFAEKSAVIIGLAVILLSVTRTWILVLGCELIVMVLLCAKINSRLILQMVTAAVVGVVGLGTLEVAGIPVLDRWTERLFVSGRMSVDPTELSRERQITSMANSIDERPYFGAGLSGESEFWLERSIGGSSEVSIARGFGHNQHVSLLFIGGVFGAGPLLLLQLFQAISAAIFMLRTRRRGESDGVLLGVLGGLIVLGTLVYGMFGGTFGDRGMTLWYGTGTGLLLAAINIFGSRIRA